MAAKAGNFPGSCFLPVLVRETFNWPENGSKNHFALEILQQPETSPPRSCTQCLIRLLERGG